MKLFYSDYENNNLTGSLNLFEDRLSKGVEPNINIQNNNKKISKSSNGSQFFET